MSMPMSKAIDIAVKGENPPEGAKLGKHSFYIRSVKFKARLKGDETSYFRHQHAGKDDRIFYSIKLGKKKGQYKAKMTRVQFRGPLVKNGFRPIGDRGIDVTDVLKLGAAGATGSWKEFLSIAKNLDLQGFVDGNWLPSAAKVVDMIGKRMAQDIR